MTWDREGVVLPAALFATATSRMVAVAVVDPDAAQWAARKTKGSQPARLLVVEVIKASTIPAGKAVAVADATFGVLRHHGDVGSALVAKAAATADEGQVRQLLEQAVRWNRPRDRAEFDPNLTTIGTAFPDSGASRPSESPAAVRDRRADRPESGVSQAHISAIVRCLS